MGPSNSAAETLAFVFVYGSLQRGQRLHRYLRDQRFAGIAHTQPSYRLFDCGDYPGLVHIQPGSGQPGLSTAGRTAAPTHTSTPTTDEPEHPGTSIRGEVFEVTTAALRILDDVEGVAEGLYARRYVHLVAPFDVFRVWAYFYLRDTSRLKDCGSGWP